MPDVGLLAIGNELLNGNVRDKNLFTLSQQLTEMGFVVKHAMIVRDIPEMIAASLYFFIEQGVDVLISSGGLGPTDDDLTLAAFADALDRPLKLNAAAHALVEAHYERLLREDYLTQRGPEAGMQKMATLPDGALPLHNPVGTAPAVALDYRNTLIYILPGVPSELEAIFSESLVPALRQRFQLGAREEQALIVHCDDEADLAPLLHDVSGRYPAVYLKSLAKPFPAASTEGLRVVASIHAPDREQALAVVTQALEDLRRVCEEAGFQVS